MPMKEPKFRREDHVYVNSQFSELLKDALRFFHGTPVLPLPPKMPFSGAGVYAIYCIAKKGLYKTFGEKINRKYYDVPIYVGKAVPAGWRQSRIVDETAGTALYSRLRQHAESVKSGKGLSLCDFACRFAILEGETANMIAALEAAIIAEHTPLWNSVIDGFGNHDPGKGRYEQKMSQWDSIHPGRPWAARLKKLEVSESDLSKSVKDFVVSHYNQ